MIDVYKIVNKKSNLMKEDFEDDLMSFDTQETNEYNDLENSDKYFDNKDFTEELNDDISQEIEDVEKSQTPQIKDDGDIFLFLIPFRILDKTLDLNNLAVSSLIRDLI